MSDKLRALLADEDEYANPTVVGGPSSFAIARNVFRAELRPLVAEMEKADHPALILRNLIRQHDHSGGWSKDCDCTWHTMARAYLERRAALTGEEA